ncbi:MAG: AmmeMemoRadiSam system protein B [Chloroflexi bacterium]|nr:AmmeMemoRadiSam system protein B [Chloroflexota bacterium]
MAPVTGPRKPAVAGAFYPASAESLRTLIDWCFSHVLGPGGSPRPSTHPPGARRLVGLVCPHAGYIYSGPVAAHSYARLAQEPRPELVVVLGPNHRGLGQPIATSPHESWETPLGVLPIERRLCERLEAQAGLVKPDSFAHAHEHSIEVQAPFLQVLYGDAVPFLPIALWRQDLRTCQRLGEALAHALAGRGAVIIASSDFTHYEPAALAQQQDLLAIDPILRLDPVEFARTVAEREMNICGPGPVMAMLTTARRLGAAQARLLKYATSGDTSGDPSSVVGYAAIEVTA